MWLTKICQELCLIICGNPSLGGLRPLRQCSKPSQIKTWNTINQLGLWNLECQAPLHKSKSPLMKTFWWQLWVELSVCHFTVVSRMNVLVNFRPAQHRASQLQKMLQQRYYRYRIEYHSRISFKLQQNEILPKKILLPKKKKNIT